MNTLKMNRFTIFSVCLALITSCQIGCGGKPDGPSTYSVSGTVKADGDPIEKGRITFRSSDGKGQAYSTEINAGEYSLKTEAGEMNIEITASREIPGKMGEAASPDEEPQPAMEMYIPKEYNTETTLKETVTADGENKFPFDLKTK